jgi:hypothetical protein
MSHPDDNRKYCSDTRCDIEESHLEHLEDRARKTGFTVDIRPSWRSLIPALVEVAANGTTAEARRIAMEELLRLADIVDRQIAKLEKESKR